MNTSNQPEKDDQRLPHDSQHAANDAGEIAVRQLLTEVINLKKQDHEHEKKLEGAKLLADTSKTQVLASAGVLLAMGALSNLLDEPTHLWLLFMAASSIFLAMAASIFAMIQWSGVIEGEKVKVKDFSIGEILIMVAGPFMLLISVGLFMVFTYLNSDQLR